jgi:hypothetical protein
MKQHEDGLYACSDTGLATYLHYKELKLLTVEFENGRGFFIFEVGNHDINALTSAYYNDTDKVLPRFLNKSYRTLMLNLRKAQDDRRTY